LRVHRSPVATHIVGFACDPSTEVGHGPHPKRGARRAR
jgi:hypothetical protein